VSKNQFANYLPTLRLAGWPHTQGILRQRNSHNHAAPSRSSEMPLPEGQKPAAGCKQKQSLQSWRRIARERAKQVDGSEAADISEASANRRKSVPRDETSRNIFSLLASVSKLWRRSYASCTRQAFGQQVRFQIHKSLFNRRLGLLGTQFSPSNAPKLFQAIAGLHRTLVLRLATIAFSA
jgi:hypothetical protein